MAHGDDSSMLLGRHTPVLREYAPHILHSIPRATARQALGMRAAMPFSGADLWHAYEMSWLEFTGKPVVRVGRFTVPCSSPNIVESKSFKLYLNSLNSTRFDALEDARQTIIRDISCAAGQAIELQLLDVDAASLAGVPLVGQCLDDVPVTVWRGPPTAGQLQVDTGRIVEEMLYSHLLRSLCPVTGQPDWATVWVHYRGAALERSALLQYIIAFREHQEFHEQCAERMFCDIWRCCKPQFLHLQAFYTRRGGLDINPFRSSDPLARPLPRQNRQ